MEVMALENGFFRLKDALKFLKSTHYPAVYAKQNGFRYEFYLSVGGNLGDVKKRFERFLKKLRSDRRFFVVNVSPLLLNKAFGYTKQEDFLNAVLMIQTSKSPNETLKILQHYEKINARKRSFKNAPRTLDLDILFFSAKVRASKKLILPHPGIYDRISVVLPIGLI